jgi:hypothetical protein
MNDTSIGVPRLRMSGSISPRHVNLHGLDRDGFTCTVRSGKQDCDVRYCSDPFVCGNTTKCSL